MSIATVFPGQGSQSQGMLSELNKTYSNIQILFKQASAVLEQDLWEICQNNPENKLNQTEFTQPIMLTADVALWQWYLQEQQAEPTILAGHSLGEYAALVAAQAISFEDAVRVVNLRGCFMQEAVPKGNGAMAAVLGLSAENIQQVLSTIHKSPINVVQAVNLNTATQTVIAGHKIAVEQAIVALKESGAKRAVVLPVSVPSHCELMNEAATRLAEVLNSIKISTPKIPVVHNVDVTTYQHPDDIRNALVKQLYKPVRWAETIDRFAKAGITSQVECGPGKVLSQLTKKITKEISANSVLDLIKEGVSNGTSK